MSNELEFINFTISFHRRLGQIIEKWSTAKELVDMLKDLSRQRQVDVLCTTHNPVLLDELGNKMIPFISYVTRDEHGDSHVNLLEEKENLAKLMASGTIGRMMVNDKI